VLSVTTAYAKAHRHAGKIGIADLSKPHGGPFGAERGSLGHDSHQNGLDVDVLYPRRSKGQGPPRSPADIDHRLAQDLVDRFVRAGAQYIFVGPHTHLHGPPGVVFVLVYHDDHMHVRIR
jgi:murein endopeptidase